MLDLAVDDPLTSLLLLAELLLFLVLAELVHLVALAGVLVDFFLLDDFLLLLDLAELEEVFVCFLEGLALGSLALLALELALALFLELILDLALDELALQHLFLDVLNAFHLELVVLILNDLGIIDLLIIFFLELLLHFLVVLIHLLLFHFLPLFVNLGFDCVLALLDVLLRVPLLKHVADEHLGVKSLHLVLLVVHGLVGAVDGQLPLLHRQAVFVRVNFPTLDLLLL